MQDRTHAGSDASHADERALLGERRPSLLRAMYAHAFSIPSMQSARQLAGRRAACVDCAVEEEPVSSEHVKVMVLAVVPATHEVGKEALRVIAVAQVDANLRQQGRVDHVGVPQVAEQKGEGGDALLVGEHGGLKDDARLLVGPALLVRPANHAEDALPRIDAHRARRITKETCAQSGMSNGQSARGVHSNEGATQERGTKRFAMRSGAQGD